MKSCSELRSHRQPKVAGEKWEVFIGYDDPARLPMLQQVVPHSHTYW